MKPILKINDKMENIFKFLNEASIVAHQNNMNWSEIKKILDDDIKNKKNYSYNNLLETFSKFFHIKKTKF